MKYPRLFEPIRIGGTLFRNRIFGSPTGWLAIPGDGYPSAEMVAYYERKAKGGAAAVTIGEMYVDREHGMGGDRVTRLDDPSSKAFLNMLAEGISRHGAVAVAELQHSGMFASGSQRLGNEIYAPVEFAPKGDVAFAGHEPEVLHEMPVSVILETIEKYADAALRAKNAGFGMVMVHSGHGWLLSQFLSPMINTRKDEWGGSFENRMRLPLAIIKRIKEKCGARFPVEARISVTESNPDGYDMDEGVKIAIALDGKADIIHCSAGNHEVHDAFIITHPSLFAPDGMNAYLAREVKKHVSTPVSAIGGFTEPELMEETIRTGGADIIAMARELLADPDMPNKARSGREEDITRCLRCFSCFSSVLANGTFRCAVNPEIGSELAYSIAESRHSPSIKRVLVAGGGVAGMQAALTAAKRGHSVILCEATERLGGTLLCEESVPFKDKLKTYLELQQTRLKKSGVDIRLNTPVTPAYASQVHADAIIAALGAKAVIPKIPGIENAVSAETAYANTPSVGDNIVILGGGLVGTELGIYLAGMGKNVTILEMLPELSSGGNELHMIAIDVKLRENNINVSFKTKALEIAKGGVKAEKDGREVFFPADTVIYAVGQTPLSEEAAALYDSAPEFHAVGDCISPTNIREATRLAYFAAAAL